MASSGQAQEPGEVQRTLNIEPQGRLVVVVKNSEAATPEGLGLDEGRKAEVKKTLKIPGTWGAKISGEQFRERASQFQPE